MNKELRKFSTLKDRVGIAIIALVSILISCFFAIGCSFSNGYITVDARSALMQPTFCMSANQHSQERLNIESITVSKVRRSSEEKKRWEFDSPSGWADVQPVWQLKYKSPNFFLYTLINNLLGRRSTSAVPCLTYGVVPRDYQEKVKALPLEPEQLYIVSTEE